MIKFLKIRNVKSPERRFGDAGIDCFIPKFDNDFINRLQELNPKCEINNGTISMSSANDILIPLGIKASFDSSIALIALNKSSVATKVKLTVGAGVIDSSYQGEIHAHLFKQDVEDVVLHEGMKIVQFVPIVINDTSIAVEDAMSDTEFYHGIRTGRGEGGFGSTGLE